jgi:hypothetical protein
MPADAVTNDESDRIKLDLELQLFKNLTSSEDKTRKKLETP